jgi:hypothetical protein
MAKVVFVPVLKKMGLQGVKFTGGPDEQGVDIEYYELTQPENDKSYVGIQFKKGDLVYSSGGSKNSVKEVKNQAEEAFEKEMHDISEHSTRFISRFIVATTGDINEKARKYIGRARQKGQDRRIDYWDGDRLAEYIQDNWVEEFIVYFGINAEEEEDDYKIVDIEYIEENYENLVQKCQRLRTTINSSEWTIVRTIFGLLAETSGSSIPLADLLMELENTEEYYSEEFKHLAELSYVYADESGFYLDGHAGSLLELFSAIEEELEDAEEETENAIQLFCELID